MKSTRPVAVALALSLLVAGLEAFACGGQASSEQSPNAPPVAQRSQGGAQNPAPQGSGQPQRTPPQGSQTQNPAPGRS